MTGWHRPDVERSTLDHLAQVVGPTSAQQMVDGLLAKGRGRRDAEVEKLHARVAELEAQFTVSSAAAFITAATRMATAIRGARQTSQDERYIAGLAEAEQLMIELAAKAVAS